MTGMSTRGRVEGPWFEDLHRGAVFDGSPPMTLTEGAAAAHAAIVGSRLRLALDHDLGARVTGQGRPFAPPALVWDVAIGQSTPVTQQVVANLFYRGLAFHRAPSLGDTLRTRTEVVALRQNAARPDRAPTGLVVLRLRTTDQRGRTVLDFWRCAMVPLRDRAGQTGHRDELGALGTTALSDVAGPSRDWDLAAFREQVPAGPGRRLVAGDRLEVVAGDLVSSAPELARLTLNIARTHHDDAAGSDGRLVYGGHTIGIALAQAGRAVPEMVTVLAWHGCDHLGPVREGDTLSSEVEVERVELLGDGRLAHLRSRVAARSGREAPDRPVLDWRFVALLP